MKKEGSRFWTGAIICLVLLTIGEILGLMNGMPSSLPFVFSIIVTLLLVKIMVILERIDRKHFKNNNKPLRKK